MPRLSIGLEQVFTNLGIVGSGYKLYFFETNTTTPKTTYSDDGLTIPNTNPVILNAAGRPDVGIWGSDSSLYRMVLGTPDSTISDVLLDPVVDVDPVDSNNTSSIVVFDPTPTAFWGTTEGTSTHYTLDPALVPITSYSSTQTFFIDFHIACGDAPDIDINNLGVLNLVKDTGQGTVVPLAAGDVAPGRSLCANNGSAIIVLNPQITYRLQAKTTDSAVFSSKRIIISNNVTDANNDIDFSAGTTFDSVNNVGFVCTAITKRLDAVWMAGDGNGGLDTGSKASNTTYHCYAIYDSTNNLADAIFSTNASSPALPTNYTRYARVGSIITNGSSNIFSFTQDGKIFTRTVSVRDLNAVGQTLNSETLRTVSTPFGIKTRAFGAGYVSSAGTIAIKIYSASMSMSSLTALDGQFNSGAGSYNGSSSWSAITNASSQVKSNGSGDSSSLTFSLFTDGWEDINL